MHQAVAAAVEAEPGTDRGTERMARAIDAVLGLTVTHPKLMRMHMAAILQQEGFIQCPEQQRLAAILEDAVRGWGSRQPGEDYRLLRALLMGAVVALLLPGAPMPLSRLRGELFQRYGLRWELGRPPPESTDPPSPAPGPAKPTPAGPATRATRAK
jgi:hypothetical protein